VKPHLCSNYIAESAGRGQCYELGNDGVGAAIIKVFTMLINGKTCEIKTLEDAIKVFEGLGFPEDCCVLNRLEKGDALNVGYSKPLISISKKYRDSSDMNSKFRSAVFKIGFEIKYKSIYEEDEFTLERKPIIPPHDGA